MSGRGLLRLCYPLTLILFQSSPDCRPAAPRPLSPHPKCPAANSRDAPQSPVGLDTDTVTLTVETLSSHLVTPKIQFSHQFFTDAICPCRTPLLTPSPSAGLYRLHRLLTGALEEPTAYRREPLAEIPGSTRSLQG
eukprot:1185151-Prorocentrum_minimum.AAC.1